MDLLFCNSFLQHHPTPLAGHRQEKTEKKTCFRRMAQSNLIEKTRRKETAVTFQQLRHVTAVAGSERIHTCPFLCHYSETMLTYACGGFWPFPLLIQFNTHPFVFITVSHKNTPNTGCPVLGVHIKMLPLFFVVRITGKIAALS